MTDKIKPVGKAFLRLRAIRAYYDGDSFGFVWNWWNPISWIFAPLALLIAAVLEGVPSAWRDRHLLGWKVSPYFQKHPEKLRWLE